MTSDKSYELLLSGFIFPCFLVNITKPDVITHLAALLVSLLIHKPVKQYITHQIICEDSAGTGLALDLVFKGISAESELSTGFLCQSCLLAVHRAAGF